MLNRMQLELTTGQEETRERAAAFARELVAPAAAEIDEPASSRWRSCARPPRAAIWACRAGRVRRARGWTTSSYALAIEAVARASATMAVILAVHNSLVMRDHRPVRNDGPEAALAPAPGHGRNGRRVCALGGRCRHRRGEPADDGDAYFAAATARRPQGVGRQRRGCRHRAGLCRDRARRARPRRVGLPRAARSAGHPTRAGRRLARRARPRLRGPGA